LGVDATDAIATRNLIRLDIDEGKPELAKSRWQALLQAEENSLDARLGLAQLALGERDVSSAREHLSTARIQHPNSLAPRLLLGQLALAEGDSELGDSVSEEALRIAPDNPDAILLRAKCLLSQRDTAAATSLLNRLEPLFESSSSADGLVAVGGLQQGLGRLDEAARSFERALSLGAGSSGPQVRAALLRIRLAQNDLESAREQLKLLEAEAAPQGLVAVLEGDIAARRGDLEAASGAYTRARDLGERDGALRLHAVELRRQRLGPATEVLVTWLKAHPNDTPVELALANVYLTSGDKLAAKAIYERVEQREPNNVLALNNLAWIYFTENDSRAEAISRRASRLAPNSPQIADTFGWILLSTGDIREAIQQLERAATRMAQNATVQYHLAVAYEKAGRLWEAQRAAQRAVDLGDFPERSEAESLIERTGGAAAQSVSVTEAG
jgi:putative PEP-CTERM system TPR-repeat lipoprotein